MTDTTTRPTHAQLTAAQREGADAGRAAGGWAADGNTTTTHARRLLAMIDAGDPAADQYLPACPALGHDDAPTPAEVAVSLGLDPDEDSYYAAQDHAEAIDALATAWDDAAREAWSDECVRVLRAAAGMPEADQ